MTGSRSDPLDPELTPDDIVFRDDPESPEEHTYAERLLELDLDEVLGGERAPDLVAATLGRAEALSEGSRVWRPVSRPPGHDPHVPAAAIAIGLFFLAGLVLLGMPWLMNAGGPFHPPPPMRVGPEPPVHDQPAAPTDPTLPSAPVADEPRGDAEREDGDADLLPVVRFLVDHAQAVEYSVGNSRIEEPCGNEDLAERIDQLLRTGRLRRLREGPREVQVAAHRTRGPVALVLRDGSRVPLHYSGKGELGIGDLAEVSVPVEGAADAKALHQQIRQSLVTVLAPAAPRALPPLADSLLGSDPDDIVQLDRFDPVPEDARRIRCSGWINYNLERLAVANVPNLVGIDVGGCSDITDAGLVHLLDSPLAARLESLELRGTQVTATGEAAIDYRMAQLRHLDLTTCTMVGDAALESIATIPTLTTLTVGSTQVTAQGLRALGGAVELRALDVGGLRMDEAGVLAVADLAQLRELRIDGDPRSLLPDSQSVKAIGSLANLEHLTLVGWTEPVWHDAISRLQGLRSLTLEGGTHGHASGVIRALTEGGSSRSALERLAVRGGRIDRVDLERIARRLRLRVLELSDVPQLTDDDLEPLHRMKELEGLSLRGSQGLTLQDVDLSLPRLRALDLSDCPLVGGAALEAIARAARDGMSLRVLRLGVGTAPGPGARTFFGIRVDDVPGAGPAPEAAILEFTDSRLAALQALEVLDLTGRKGTLGLRELQAALSGCKILH